MYGEGDTAAAEVERVKAAGGWVEDGRVCDMIAVSRAFGDPDFKGPGMADMLARGVKCARGLPALPPGFFPSGRVLGRTCWSGHGESPARTAGCCFSGPCGDGGLCRLYQVLKLV